MLPITAFAAAILALLFVKLSIDVIRQRRRAKASVGDHGDAHLIKAIRTQANCAEYVPMGIILLGLAEMQHVPAWLVFCSAAALVLGRVFHAVGFGRTPQIIPLRRIGMLLTFGQISGTALVLLVATFV